MNERALRIGELAKRTDVAVDTIRYYEKLGLLPPATRTRAGYRAFAPESAERLRFIRHAQELGFTLEEIGELLALRVEPTGSCDEVRGRALERLEIIERKLAHLARMRDALADLVAACESRTSTAECPILAALDRDDDDAPHH